MSNTAAPNNEFAIRSLDFDGEDSITRESVDSMIQQIRTGRIESAFLSLDEYGEEDFLTADIKDGWAALAYNTWDETGYAHQYRPVNPAYKGSTEDAPVEIGGQTPVRKRNALDNLDLAAECVLHFAKTGELYPRLEWEEAQ